MKELTDDEYEMKFAQFLELDVDPTMSAKDIARIVGVSSRTISRWRTKAQRNRSKASVPHTPETWARVEQLMAERCPVMEIARTTGVGPVVLARHYPDYRITVEERNETIRLMKQAAVILHPDWRPQTV